MSRCHCFGKDSLGLHHWLHICNHLDLYNKGKRQNAEQNVARTQLILSEKEESESTANMQHLYQRRHSEKIDGTSAVDRQRKIAD